MMEQFEEFNSPSVAFIERRRMPSGIAPDPNERYRYLMANTPTIIYSSVPSGDFKMTFVSENATRVLGYQPSDMLSDPNFWFDHIHPEDVPIIFASLAQVFAGGLHSYEYRFRASDGRYLWMHDTLRLIRDEDGQPFEVIGSLTDITERKLMEEALHKKGEEQELLISKLRDTQQQLLESEKMASIGQLAAGMAHEINNPIGFVTSNMGSLRTYVDTLMQVIDGYDALMVSMMPAADVAAGLQKIRDNADLEYLKGDLGDLFRDSLGGLKRVKDIVQALTDFSGVGESDWELADVHKGIERTLAIFNLARHGNISLEKRYAELPLIRCFPSALDQVFMNLLANAADAIDGAGVIKIETGCSADAVFVRISDTGCGIATTDLPRIFEPFFTTKAVGGGTGLGLSLSYGMIKKHNGRIDVCSEPGSGATFTVHLPLAPVAPADLQNT